MPDALLNEEGWEALANIRLRRLEEVNAENTRLRRIEVAALAYFVSYCRDEAEELECCVSPEQHKAAQELRDALANKGSSSNG